MKTQFSWYYPISEYEFDAIWEKAFFTLDANVLLDLYRLNKKTTDTLITYITSLGEKLWLSNQAAKEFVRNRNKVKIDSKKFFDEVNKLITDYEKEKNTFIDNLNGKKIIDKDSILQLSSDIDNLIESFKSSVCDAQNEHKKDLKSDTILEWVFNTFDGVVGDPIAEDVMPKWIEEAKQRIEAQIPPGFRDKNKDADKSYGDFFLWKQILDKAKNSSNPIIFITSEKKDDWWEQYSGETCGQRIELLEEAFKCCGQKIVILKTEKFLEIFAKKSGKFDSQTAEAIDELKNLRNDNRLVYVLSQEFVSKNEFENRGKLTIRVDRPAPFFTASGQLIPTMICPPQIDVSLISTPGEMPYHSLMAKTGTRHDFNIHARTLHPNYLFPAGVYEFEYTAICYDGITADAQFVNCNKFFNRNQTEKTSIEPNMDITFPD